MGVMNDLRIAVLSSFLVLGCATPFKSPLGPLDWETHWAAEEVVRTLEAGKTVGDFDSVSTDPSNRYSNTYIKTKYYVNDRTLGDYDHEFLSRVLDLNDLANAKSIFVEHGRTYRKTPGTFIFYTHGIPDKTKQIPVSMFIASKSSVDADFLLALRVSVYSADGKVEPFKTLNGFEGYLVEKKESSGKGEAKIVKYMVGSSETHVILIRIVSSLSTLSSTDRLEAPVLALRNLEKQTAIVAKESKIALDRCDMLNGANKATCKAEEAEKIAAAKEKRMREAEDYKRQRKNYYCNSDGTLKHGGGRHSECLY